MAGDGEQGGRLLAGSGVPACAVQDVSSDYIPIHTNTAVCLVTFTTMATVVDGLQYPGDILSGVNWSMASRSDSVSVQAAPS